jgi:hypothetical protein
MSQSLEDRGRVEAAGIAAGTHLQQRATPKVLGFDTTTMPVHLKLPVKLRDPRTVVMLTVHVTAVKGGFGVEQRKVAGWRRLLELGKVPGELLSQLPDHTDLGGSSFLLALLERYSRVAYHRVASRRAGNVRNHPLSLRTSHGNGGNDGAGWAIDCGNTERLSAELIEIGRTSLESQICEVISEGGGKAVVIPHRVWSSKRTADTGRPVWSEIVAPTVQRLAKAGLAVEIGYNTKGGTGRPIPRSWDANALFDDQGRRLKG